MSTHAAQIIRSDFDLECKKARDLGYTLVFQHYLQNLTISRQHIRSWDEGAQISVNVARRIEEASGGRISFVSLLGTHGTDDRRHRREDREDQGHDIPR